MPDNALALIPAMPKDPLMTKDPMSNEYVMHPAWIHYHSQINTVLQTRLSHEGFKVTQQPTANINAMNNNIKSDGNFLYDSDEGVMKVNNFASTTGITGTNVYKEIYTRPEQLTAAQVAAIPTAQINGKWVFETDSAKLKYGINNVFREVTYI